MGEHCLSEARRLGFRAMQFNFVVSTNEGAVRLWKQLGFDIVGTLPGAFRHPKRAMSMFMSCFVRCCSRACVRRVRTSHSDVATGMHRKQALQKN